MARRKSARSKSSKKVQPLPQAVKGAENRLGYNPYNGRPTSFFGGTGTIVNP